MNFNLSFRMLVIHGRNPSLIPSLLGKMRTAMQQLPSPSTPPFPEWYQGLENIHIMIGKVKESVFSIYRSIIVIISRILQSFPSASHNMSEVWQQQ